MLLKFLEPPACAPAGYVRRRAEVGQNVPIQPDNRKHQVKARLPIGVVDNPAGGIAEAFDSVTLCSTIAGQTSGFSSLM